MEHHSLYRVRQKYSPTKEIAIGTQGANSSERIYFEEKGNLLYEKKDVVNNFEEINSTHNFNRCQNQIRYCKTSENNRNGKFNRMKEDPGILGRLKLHPKNTPISAGLYYSKIKSRLINHKFVTSQVKMNSDSLHGRYHSARRFKSHQRVTRTYNQEKLLVEPRTFLGNKNFNSFSKEFRKNEPSNNLSDVMIHPNEICFNKLLSRKVSSVEK